MVQPETGCRFNGQQTRWEMALRVVSILVCIGLFCLGFTLLRLPFQYPGNFNTGQWLSNFAQGLAIMVLVTAALIDNVYATPCVRNNFGFFSHLCGRGTFYILMGLYSLPTMSMLKTLSEETQGDESTHDAVSSGLALFGVISAFIVGVAHIVMMVRQQGSSEKGSEAGLKASPQTVGSGSGSV